MNKANLIAALSKRAGRNGIEPFRPVVFVQ